MARTESGAVYENKYLLGTALARPVIAKHQVEVALCEGASAVGHGCTGKGNDQVRFEMAYQALAPELKVVAPWREWDLKSREDCLDYAEKRGIPVAAEPRENSQPRSQSLACQPRRWGTRRRCQCAVPEHMADDEVAARGSRSEKSKSKLDSKKACPFL